MANQFHSISRGEKIQITKLIVRRAQQAVDEFREKDVEGITTRELNGLKSSTARHLVALAHLYGHLDEHPTRPHEAEEPADTRARVFNDLGYEELDDFGFQWGSIEFKDGWQERVLADSLLLQDEGRFMSFSDRYKLGLRRTHMPSMKAYGTVYESIYTISLAHRSIEDEEDGSMDFQAFRGYIVPSSEFQSEKLKGSKSVAEGNTGPEGTVLLRLPHSLIDELEGNDKPFQECNYFKRRPSPAYLFLSDSPSTRDSNIVEQLPRAIIKAAAICQEYGTTCMRGVVSNGTEWIFFVLSTDNKAFHHFWTSEPFSIQKESDPLGDLPLVVALLEYWILHTRELDLDICVRRDAELG